MNEKKAIGGYFGLELGLRVPLHTKAIALNSGRNALEFIIRTRRYTKIWIPYFTCGVIQERLRFLNIDYEYYRIDENFEPIFNMNCLSSNEAFLYTNYYGIKNDFISTITGYKNVILDQCHAFYEPSSISDSFNSCRKFFGVPDGGYAYLCDIAVPPSIQDVSATRCAHLLIRTDQSAEAGYAAYQENETLFKTLPLQRMSQLTQALLASVDYEGVAAKRCAHYQALATALQPFNKLSLSQDPSCIPMVYPLWCREGERLRKYLIGKRIFVAQYWPEVLDLCSDVSIEASFARDIVPLPVDQRLSAQDLKFIINSVLECLSKENT